MIGDLLVRISEKIKGFFATSMFADTMERYIREQYSDGLEVAGQQFQMNFVSRDEDVSFLVGYANKNLGFHTDALGEELRQELSRGIMAKETVPQLKKRIKEVFKDDKFVNRMKTVLRTEKLRANNMGQIEGARQSGLELMKWLDTIQDQVTSNVCKKEQAKYGSPEKAIPLNEPFVVKVNKKEIRGQEPPFHPNCRTVVRFERVVA